MAYIEEYNEWKILTYSLQVSYVTSERCGYFLIYNYSDSSCPRVLLRVLHNYVSIDSKDIEIIMKPKEAHEVMFYMLLCPWHFFLLNRVRECCIQERRAVYMYVRVHIHCSSQLFWS